MDIEGSAEMAEYLVELGIDSISVTPDTLLEVRRKLLAVEHRLGQGAGVSAPRTSID